MPSQSDTLIQAVQTVQASNFEAVALEVFRYQAEQNPLYNEFLSLLNISVPKIKQLSDIPALPISFFKSHCLQTGEWQAEQCFQSSGTTGQTPSRHFIASTDFYLNNAQAGFEQFYGAVDDWIFLALLPNYLERGSSSLVAMVDDFIQKSKHEESSFYLYDHKKLAETLQKCRKSKKKTMLIGVSYALLDFADAFPMDLSDVVIVETGGMKGRRAEWTKAALHSYLAKAFQCATIHSEYGMTELLSQGWSAGSGLFFPSKTMAVRAMEVNDPFAEVVRGKTGRLNIIDLANFSTCSFIATDDLGRVYADGSFEVMGRLDSSEWRGCNLMVGALD